MDTARLALAVRLSLRKLAAGGYLHVFSANAMLQMLGFGSVLLVAKFLSAPELALVKTTQAYAAVLVVLAGGGLTAPILLYCADTKINDDDKRRMLFRSVLYTCWVGAVVVVLAIAFVEFFQPRGSIQAKVQLIYALVLPGLALTSLLFVYFQSRQSFAFLARSQTLIKTMSVVFVVLATWMYGLNGFLIATVATVYVGLMPLIWSALRGAAAGVHSDLPRDFISRAGFGMFGTFITMLGQSSDFMLMDFVKTSPVDVGRYALASIFLMAATTLTGVAQTIVTPRFTALRHEQGAFEAELRQWGRRMPLLSIAAAIGTFLVAWLFERFFFGSEYAGFTELLAILLVRYVVWSSYAIIGSALAGGGVIKSGVAVAALTTIVSFIIGLPLCKSYGAVGAAVTQVLVSIVALGAIQFVYRVQRRRLFS